MKNVKYILIFFFAQKFILSAQNNFEIDSLQKFINTTTIDTVKADALYNLSKKFQTYNLDTALTYGQKGLALSIKLNYQQGIGKANNNVGDIYWFKANYDSASSHYFKALDVFEYLKDRAAIAECYRNIGWIYQGQNNFNQTLNYYLKSLQINQQLNLNEKVEANFDDLSILYRKMKKYPEALDYCKKTRAIAQRTGSRRGIASSYTNMGAIYFEMGKYQSAIETLKLAAKIHKEDKDDFNLVCALLDIAKSYLKLKQVESAIKYGENALKIAKQYDYRTEISLLYQLLAIAYSIENDYSKAYTYSQLYTVLQESIYNENNSKQINEMSAKYESEKKELMISNLEKGKALSEEKFQKEKNLKIYLSLFCLLIAISAFILFKGNIQKRKANQKLSLAYEQIEIKNKDITDSINYSKRIQDASLPSKKLLSSLFPEAFILFKPKDIVSGDFYWYTEKNGKRLIACCDCTGHGVPGALMSMIGNNMLNQIVNEKGITSPEEILNLLHKEVRTALKQEEQTSNKDGMDIALITFNSTTEIEYAGANRPLWIIKPSNEVKNSVKVDTGKNAVFTTAQLIEIKPDKFSIGGQQSETERKFIKHSLSLEKGDSIYLFSDGFVDQFGGPEGKKYMSKRLKELLFASYNKPINDQENILSKTMTDWKGNHDQVDDILVIGINI
ncbi:MAG: tetratricopeptide repeat protein [Bacteroidota bacterium]